MIYKGLEMGYNFCISKLGKGYKNGVDRRKFGCKQVYKYNSYWGF